MKNKEIIRVPKDYPTIQRAIDACPDGGEVWIRNGIYKGEENKNLRWVNKKITVCSTNGSKNCIIDCEDKGTGFSLINEGDDCGTIKGFTIKNGSDDYGGGIYCDYSSPTIIDCIILKANASCAGGGIYCYYSSPTIKNCTISRAESIKGGGIYCKSSAPTIIRCTIIRAKAPYGGGIHCESSSPTITRSVIVGNKGEEGGGIYTDDNSSPNITNCTISENKAIYGGGIFCNNSSPIIIDCEISENKAKKNGGGIYRHISSRLAIERATVIARGSFFGNSPNNYYADCSLKSDNILSDLLMKAKEG